MPWPRSISSKKAMSCSTSAGRLGRPVQVLQHAVVEGRHRAEIRLAGNVVEVEDRAGAVRVGLLQGLFDGCVLGARRRRIGVDGGLDERKRRVVPAGPELSSAQLLERGVNVRLVPHEVEVRLRAHRDISCCLTRNSAAGAAQGAVNAYRPSPPGPTSKG